MPLLSIIMALAGSTPALKQRRHDGNVGGPSANKYDPHLVDRLADDFQGVDQSGQSDACRALLIVMPHRDFGILSQGVQNPEAFWLGDIFQVNAAESGLQQQRRVG